MKKIAVKLIGGTDTLSFLKPSPNKFVVTGSGNLSGSYAIQSDGNETLYMVTEFFLACNVNLITYTFTILGNTINQKVLLGNSIIKLIYNGSTWDIISIANSKTDGKKGVSTETITSSGGNLAIDLLNGNSRYTFLGTATLSNHYIVTATNMIDGDEVFIQYKAVITKGSFNVSILGTLLSTELAINGDLFIYAKYNGSAWIVSVVSDFTNLYKIKASATDTTPDYFITKFDPDFFEQLRELATIKAGSITLPKLSNTVEGFIEKDVTDTQFIALYTTPLELISASLLPSSAYGFIPTHASYQIVSADGEYYESLSSALFITSSDDATNCGLMKSETIIGKVDQQICTFEPVYPKAATDWNLKANSALYLSLDGEITGGNVNNIIRVKVYYKAIKLV